jgi:AcrR family transcriptional regulator
MAKSSCLIAVSDEMFPVSILTNVARVNQMLTVEISWSGDMATAPKKRSGQRGDKPYHHGALREALLDAAVRILEREGVAGLTLRAAAREAGASHAAPKNHFGDLTGLLSEVAAAGFARFADQMLAAAERETAPQARLNAAGRAYVAFAVAEPGLFRLMFRGERLDMARPALRAASARAYRVLTDAVTAAYPQARPNGPETVRAWSLAHGYAMLLLDHRLDPVLAEQPMGPDPVALAETVLGL